MASINDVAKLAGVSKSTVSKVLNDYDTISEDTKIEVYKAVKQLNYIPNQIAVALSKGDTKKVALVVDPTKDNQTIDGLNINYILGANHKFDELKIEVVTIFSTMFLQLNKDEIEMYLRKRAISGIIFFGVPIHNKVMNEIISNEQFKVVVVDVEITNSSTSSISIDNYKAQQEVARQIIAEKGLRKILYISGEDGGDSGQIRRKAIEDLAAELDLNLSIMDGEYSEKKAEIIVKKYGFMYDGILCASDLMAIGAMRELKRQKLNRPITGFDGIDLMAYVDEKILTVIQNFSQIGEIAAAEVNSLLDGKDGKKITVEHEIGYVDIRRVIK